MSKELTIDDLQVGKSYVTVESNLSLVILVEPVLKTHGQMMYYFPKSRLVLEYAHFDPSIRFQEIEA